MVGGRLLAAVFVRRSALFTALFFTALAPSFSEELSMEGYPAFPSAEEMQQLSELYNRSRELQWEKNYRDAALAMEELVASDWPFELDQLTFKLSLAHLYERAEMGERAKELLVSIENSTTRNHPLFPEIYFQLTMAILKGGDRAEGLERLDYLAQRFSSSDAGQEALLLLARSHRDDGDITSAWTYYDRYLVTYLGRKKRDVTLLEAAEMFFDADELARGEELALQVWSEIHRYPDSGNKGIQLIRLFKRKDLTDSALQVAASICGSEKEQAQEACFLAGQIHADAGDATQAVAGFRSALENYPFTRLSVRAYKELGKLSSADDALPEIPAALLHDKDNEHWVPLMTEVARLAAKRGMHGEVINALTGIQNTGDRASEQRARMYLNACLDLVDEDDAHACAWMEKAVAVRPLLRDHEKAIREWAGECAVGYTADAFARVQDLASADPAFVVKLLDELMLAWGLRSPEMTRLLRDVWSLKLDASDRLFLAPAVLQQALAGKAGTWREDLDWATFAMQDNPDEAYNRAAYVSIFDLLQEHEKFDEALTWFLAFAQYAEAPGMERTEKLLNRLHDEKNVSGYDAVFAHYLRWYPASGEITSLAAKQALIRISGPDVEDAWAMVEHWLSRLDAAGARRLLDLVQPSFMSRGSKYVEAINAYLLSAAGSEEETIDAHRDLGTYYLKMMDFDKAVIHLEKAFSMSLSLPDDEKVKLGISLLKAAAEAGYEERYVRYLMAGIERVMLDVQDVDVKAAAGNRLGKLLQELGLHEDAYRMFRETAELDPQNNSSKGALYNLAKSYSENGDDAKAIATYMEFLEKYDGEIEPRFYNIALANALAIAMKSAEPELINELQLKAEALVNGVEDPQILLDLAQYFGRQGHADVQAMLLKKGLDEARKVIDTAATPEEQHKALEAAVKRLFKMGYYNESTALGEQYYQEALANNPATQSERLHFAQYEMLRAKLGSAYGMNQVVSEQAAALYEVAKANDYHDAAVKYLMLMANESPSREDRFSAKEELVRTYPDSQPAFRAKVDLAGKAYAEGDKEKARTIALNALAQASGDYQKNFAENIRFNALYINAVLLDEEGRSDLSAPMWQEIENYEFKDSWIYVDEIMKGEPSGYY